MNMRVLHATHPEMIPGLDTEALRRLYLVSGLFKPDEISLTYSHIERKIVGGALPTTKPLPLAPYRENAGVFLARRELGVINIGGPGSITTDGTVHEMNPRDGLYVGMGTENVVFASKNPAEPAKFYFVSAPAHMKYDTVRIAVDKTMPMPMGAVETANKRTIYQYLHPEICKTSQLLMGLTALEPGSIWNTMPCHLHDRRSETYFYFGMSPEQRVFHFMGEPTQTRHLIVANEEAVVSPPWSIHMGAGTSNYTFIWAMAGENQEYKDMDALPLATLR
jgi:4-deoxy-L-threo-5-hexosulose-uronate ketol-isomerase